MRQCRMSPDGAALQDGSSDRGWRCTQEQDMEAGSSDGAVRKEGQRLMNFYDKKVRRIISIIIMVVIVAMLATMVIPYLM